MNLAKKRRITGSNRGSAVLVVLLLIAVVFLYLNVNVRSLHHLKNQLKLVEKRQVERLKHQAQPGTNLVSQAAVLSKE